MEQLAIKNIYLEKQNAIQSKISNRIGLINCDAYSI